MFEGRDDVISEAKTYLENDSTVKNILLPISANITCSYRAVKTFIGRWMSSLHGYKTHSLLEYACEQQDKCKVTGFKYIYFEKIKNPCL